MKTKSRNNSIIPNSKRCLFGKEYILINGFKIVYGWHIRNFGFVYVLKKKTIWGWQRVSFTYAGFHNDFQSIVEYLFWYKDILESHEESCAKVNSELLTYRNLNCSVL